MELLKKMFPSILDIQNANNKRQKYIFFQINTKDRMTHFNSSVIAKYRRDSYVKTLVF